MPGNNRAAVAYVAGGAPIMCTVADISEGGAGLTFANVGGVPDTFRLEIKGDPDVRFCKVAWRQPPYRIGVSFEPSE